METVVYRKRQRVPLVMETSSNDMSGILDQAELPESFQETGDLHPALFYPRISEAELTMWTHWLPTALVFRGGSQALCKSFLNRLERFNAPQEVVEECQWAWNMDLFEAYELRTPERRDMRDPVVLGRIGTQRYRIERRRHRMRAISSASRLCRPYLAPA